MALAFIAAPSAFAVLPTDMAGRVAGRLFHQEAHAGLGIAVLLIVCLRRHAGHLSKGMPSAELMCALGALFCTVAGYFALQPVLQAARAGQTDWPFAAWHGVSMAFFAVKGVLVLALGWRLTGPAHRSPAPAS